jgi:hypothetical protein
MADIIPDRAMNIFSFFGMIIAGGFQLTVPFGLVIAGPWVLKYSDAVHSDDNAAHG